jgi:hypothetical protein
MEANGQCHRAGHVARRRELICAGRGGKTAMHTDYLSTSAWTQGGVQFGDRLKNGYNYGYGSPDRTSP